MKLAHPERNGIDLCFERGRDVAASVAGARLVFGNHVPITAEGKRENTPAPRARQPCVQCRGFPRLGIIPMKDQLLATRDGADIFAQLRHVRDDAQALTADVGPGNERKRQSGGGQGFPHTFEIDIERARLDTTRHDGEIGDPLPRSGRGCEQIVAFRFAA